jgi:hypothetical protein
MKALTSEPAAAVRRHLTSRVPWHATPAPGYTQSTWRRSSRSARRGAAGPSCVMRP